MYSFLKIFGYLYWKFATLSATVMAFQMLKRSRPDIGLLELLVCTLVAGISASAPLWGDILWSWVQHEYTIQQILNNRLYRGSQITLPNLCNVGRALKAKTIIWIFVIVVVAITVCLLDNTIVAAMIVGTFVTMTVILLALCSYWRIDRYRKREMRICDIWTATRIVSGDWLTSREVRTYSPNELKKPQSYLMSL